MAELKPAETPEEMIALVRRLINREYREAGRGNDAARVRAKGLVNVRKFMEDAVDAKGV